MEQTKRLTIELLRCALTGESPEKALPESELKAVYLCAARFDVAQCVGYALQIASRLPEGSLGDSFQNKQTEAVWRTEQQEYMRERIGDILEQGGIEHIFLKGAALRRLYPKPWLRTGVDLDVLVRKEEQEKAIMLLCQRLGCSPGQRTAYDVKLRFRSGQCAELHVRLSGNASAESELSNVWEDSLPAAGKRFERMLSPELFYVYHIAHMAKHFEEGGCGIRPLMDLWVMEQAMPRNEAVTHELLRRAGLSVFAGTAERLKDCWFSGGAGDLLTQRMSDFIFSGGAFGSVEKRVAVDRVKTGGKFKNLIARAVLPYETMVGIYPPLETHRWRLPYYEVCRWCRLLFCGRAKSVLAELRNNQTITEEEIRTTEVLLKDLELL